MTAIKKRFNFKQVVAGTTPGGEGEQRYRRHTHYTTPDKPLLIGDIIYPDRYDLILRSRYVDFCIQHRTLWETDSMGFLEKARTETPFALSNDMLQCLWTFWRDGRFLPGPHHESFRRDTEKVMDLLGLCEGEEWMDGSRIKLIRSDNILAGIDGRTSYIHNWWMADGQHRLANLHYQGRKELLPEQYRFLEYPLYRPFVTSYIYERVGMLPDAETFRREAYGLD